MQILPVLSFSIICQTTNSTEFLFVWVSHFSLATHLVHTFPLPSFTPYVPPNCRSSISTGGDTEGHPGFSIYQQGVFLFGVVSTGTQYWETRVAGAVSHDKWTNVGLRWAADLGVEVSQIVWNGYEGMLKVERLKYIDLCWNMTGWTLKDLRYHLPG